MYAKLIFRSARRSARDYLVYILTMTICAALFYGFLSISSRFYQPDIGAEYNYSMLSDGMKMAICGVTLLLLFLIRFANRYMLRSRQKEFALEAVMGMEQRTIARLFFAETLLMGGMAVLLGIGLGAVCSQFVTALLLTSYGQNYHPVWTLFPDTVLWTAGFFLMSFLAVGLLNTRTIRCTPILSMLSAQRENETPLQKSRWMQGVAALYLVLAAARTVQGVRLLARYGDSRLALPIQLMFWANILVPAGLLVWAAVWAARRRKWHFPVLVLGLTTGALPCILSAVSLPVLQRRYMLGLGVGWVNQWLVFLLADLLFLLCGVIWLASALLAWRKDHSPDCRYQGTNLFYFGQMVSKLRTTSKTMALVSITLVLSVFLFAAAPVLSGWANGYLEARAVYDIQIYSRYNDVREVSGLPGGNYDAVTRFLDQNGIDTTADCTFSLYLPQQEDFYSRVKYDFPAAAISLSDYNAIRSMLGLAPVTLAEGEFTTQWKTIASEEEQDAFLAEHTAVSTDAGVLMLAEQACYTDPMGETFYNSYTDLVYVFPDAVCKQLLPVMRCRYIMTAEPLSYETAHALEAAFAETYPEQTAGGANYSIRLRTLQVNSTRASNFVLQAAMLYGAVVLMVICLTVLSLQQLLDAGQYRYRFSVLRKLGVEETEIRSLVVRQLGFWFGLPVGTAVLTGAAAVGCLLTAVQAEIQAYIGFGALAVQLGVTAFILFILLGCYFTSTWALFQRAVDP